MEERSYHFNYTQSTVRNQKELDDLITAQLEDKELSKGFLKEVRMEFLDALDNILFIHNLSYKERPRIKDLPRWDAPYRKNRVEDPNGRIEVNLTNPHILEDMDYFRKAAIQFETSGRYTHLYPNSNPHSEYAQHWAEEARRCREGLVRESDGEWIPGYFYFYLNYSPIQRLVADQQGQEVRTEGFPSIYDGDYIFFHYLDKARKKGRHTATLKTRGSGFSFKGGSKIGRNFIHGETARSSKKTKSFAIANEKEYLVKDGILNKYLDIVNFNAEHTPFPRAREKDSLNDMEWKMGYKDKSSNRSEGVQNSVMGVTLKNDPHRARGKRGVLIEWEEVGSFTNFLTAWGVARPSVEANTKVFGLMNAYGTGGEEGVDFAGLQEIFYNPKGYNILHMPNVFDSNTHGNTESAFFFGAYLNAEGCYDKDGNSDIIKSLIETFVNRINVKYNTQDPNAIVQEKAERPITPQEAVMRTEGTAFPVGALKEDLEKIRVNYQQHVNEHYIGLLYRDNNNVVKWRPDNTLLPIHTFPLKDNKNAFGAIEIFEMPKKNGDGVVQNNRYILGSDPIDNDYTVKGSLASVFVFDLWTNRIVAEYSGRPVLASEYYDICINLCEFYNGSLNYENNLKGLFGHFSNQNKLHLLCDTPQYLRDAEIVKGPLTGNRNKGTRTNKEIIKLGKTLQRQWMLSQQTILSDGGEEEEVYFNHEKIRSIGYLEECIKWNPDGNFDRVSAMDMVMILKEDIGKRALQHKDEENDPYRSKDEGDDFIDANWNKVKEMIEDIKVPEFNYDFN